MTENEQDFKENIKFIMDNKDKFVILDTETTGLAKKDEIIEISIINLDGEVLLDTFVKPLISISKASFNVHGISDEEVKSADTWDLVWPKVEKIVNNKKIIAYNAQFDIRMIIQSCKHSGIPEPRLRHLCMMDLVTEWKGYRPKLESFASKEQDHRALSDCRIILEDIILKNL